MPRFGQSPCNCFYQPRQSFTNHSTHKVRLSSAGRDAYLDVVLELVFLLPEPGRLFPLLLQQLIELLDIRVLPLPPLQLGPDRRVLIVGGGEELPATGECMSESVGTEFGGIGAQR